MNISLSEPMSPHQRVFGTLRNLVETVRTAPDLNVIRGSLETSLDRALSWETELADVPQSPTEQPDAGRIVAVEGA